MIVMMKRDMHSDINKEEIKRMSAHIVYENDVFGFEYGIEPKIKHKKAKLNCGNPVWAYVVFELSDGGECFEIMNMENIRNLAKRYPKLYYGDFWKTKLEKTVNNIMTERALKYIHLKRESEKAAATGEAVKIRNLKYLN